MADEVAKALGSIPYIATKSFGKKNIDPEVDRERDLAAGCQMVSPPHLGWLLLKQGGCHLGPLACFYEFMNP